jgi:hypothetical protein
MHLSLTRGARTATAPAASSPPAAARDRCAPPDVGPVRHVRRPARPDRRQPPPPAPRSSIRRAPSRTTSSSSETSSRRDPSSATTVTTGCTVPTDPQVSSMPDNPVDRLDPSRATVVGLRVFIEHLQSLGELPLRRTTSSQSSVSCKAQFTGSGAPVAGSRAPITPLRKRVYGVAQLGTVSHLHHHRPAGRRASRYRLRTVLRSCHPLDPRPDSPP